eukprot:6906278-Pyramimonas_sp.AAC.1
MRKFDASQFEIAVSDQQVAPDPVSLQPQHVANYIIHITHRPRLDFDFQQFIDIRARVNGNIINTLHVVPHSEHIHNNFDSILDLIFQGQ